MTPQQSVIITGGNSGLGYACAEHLAATKAWHVVLAVRDLDKGTEAVKRLRERTGWEAVSRLELDLASLTSIRAFAETFEASDLPPLRGLVNNAGLQLYGDTRYTQEGFEMTFGVNHLGPYLLTHLLLKQLLAPARVVFVSSGTHDPDTMDGRANPPYDRDAQTLAHPEQFPSDSSEREERGATIGIRRYSTSKLCNLYAAYEFSRRLFAEGRSTQHAPITVNAFDPGALTNTALTREWHPLLRASLNVLKGLQFVPGVNVHSAEESGEALAKLVVKPGIKHLSGRYFQGEKEVKSSRASHDQRSAVALWQASNKLVGLRANETILEV